MYARSRAAVLGTTTPCRRWICLRRLHAHMLYMCVCEREKTLFDQHVSDPIYSTSSLWLLLSYGVLSIHRHVKGQLAARPWIKQVRVLHTSSEHMQGLVEAYIYLLCRDASVNTGVCQMEPSCYLCVYKEAEEGSRTRLQSKMEKQR